MIHRHEIMHVPNLCPRLRPVGAIHEYDFLLNRNEPWHFVYRFYLYNSLIRTSYTTVIGLVLV